MDYKIPEPRLPTLGDVKQAVAATVEALRNPPDPSQMAGNIVNAARQGDYAGAMEQGLTMPGVGLGMFVPPYDMARLKQAHNMRALGADKEAIWKKTQTGDLGSGMVQEIDDRAMTLNLGAVPNRMAPGERLQMVRQGNPGASPVELNDALRAAEALDQTPRTVAAGDVMRHPQLLEAAPEAGDMQMRRGPGPGYDYTSQQLTLDPRATPAQQRIDALGGLQRYIAEQNGWSMGGADTRMFKGEPEIARTMPESFFEAQANRLAGNQLAKATQRRADMTPEQRAARFPEADMDMPLNQQIMQRFR